MKRILIADDHDVVRRGIRALLEDAGYDVVAECADGHEAVEAALRLQPDVIVIDLSMPRLNGFEATRRIRSACPASEVLVLTVHESDQVVREVLQAGARGYVLKSDAGKDLVTAIESLSEQRPFFTAKVSNIVLEGYLGLSPMKPTQDATGLTSLTAREQEVLQAIVEGKTNKEIADQLAISIKTVETHRSNIMRKLKVRSVVDLVRLAIRNRITPG